MRSHHTRAVLAVVSLALTLLVAVTASPAIAGVPTPMGGGWTALPAAAVYSGSLGAGAVKTVTVTGVPAGASAWLTVSETGATASGTLTVTTHGLATPTVPAVAFAAGQSASNSAVISTSSGGQVDVMNTSTAAVPVRVDVSGYYAAGSPSRAAMFGAVAPYRVANAVTVAAHGSTSLTVAGVGGVPSTAPVVAANLTVSAPSAAGVLTAYPTGATVPDTQSLEFTSGRPAAALNAVRVGTGGTITVANSAAVPVTLTASVLGYYTAGTPHVGGAFTKTAPTHLFDTSTGLDVAKAAVAAGAGLTVPVAGVAGVPSSGVAAVVVQLGASAATKTGYLTAYATGGTKPSTPFVDFGSGRPAAQVVVVPVSSSGKITVVNASSGPVEIRGDLVGYVTYATALTWTAPTRAAKNPVADITGLSCPTTTSCLAVDADGNTIAYNGTSWTRTVGALSDGGGAIDCITVSFCMHVGTDGAAATWNGSAWSPAGTAAATASYLSCASTAYCVEIGTPQQSEWTVWKGSTWSTVHPLSTTIASLSCPAVNVCLASAANGQGWLKFNGTTWTAPAMIPGFVSGSQSAESLVISCTSATFCLAAGTAQNTTSPFASVGSYATYSGSTWSTPAAAPNYDEVEALDCVSPTACAAVVGNGYLTRDDYTTTFTGSGWSTPHSLDPSATGIELVSCPATTVCVATVNGTASVWRSSAWSAPATVDPDALYGMTLLDCTSASFCVGGNGVMLQTWNGSAWATARQLAPGADFLADTEDDLTGVSCVSPTFCVAVTFGDDDFASWGDWALWNGSTWTVHPKAFPAALNGVSCVSTTFCTAVGFYYDDGQGISQGEAYRFDGTSWTRTGVFPESMTTVSCPSSTRCIATGGGFGAAPYSSTYTGTSWTSPTTFGDSTTYVTGLSCQAATFCLAVDDSGRAYPFTGTSWGAATQVASGALSGISCGTAGACLAAGPGGAVQQYAGGGRWKPAAAIDSGGAVGAVSCPSAAFCMAVDSRGWATSGSAS